jgi:hypothetical protein
VLLVVAVGPGQTPQDSGPPQAPPGSTSPEVPIRDAVTADAADQRLWSGGRPAVVLNGTLPILTPEGRRQDRINREIAAEVAAWAEDRADEMRKYDLDIPRFDLETRIHFLDQHLYSVEIRITTSTPTSVHPLRRLQTFVYRLADGARLSLKSMFMPYGFTLREQIYGAIESEEIRRELEEEEARRSMTGEPAPPWLYRDFLVDDRGIVLVYPPCVLNVCAGDYVSVTIPYADLVGLIDPDGVAAPYL